VERLARDEHSSVITLVKSFITLGPGWRPIVGRAFGPFQSPRKTSMKSGLKQLKLENILNEET